MLPPSSASTRLGRGAAPVLRFVVLQHGFRGDHGDLKLLQTYLRPECWRASPHTRHGGADADAEDDEWASAPPPIVMVPDVNDGKKTDDGVHACAARLVDVICRRVRHELMECRPVHPLNPRALSVRRSPPRRLVKESDCCCGCCCCCCDGDARGSRGDWAKSCSSRSSSPSSIQQEGSNNNNNNNNNNTISIINSVPSSSSCPTVGDAVAILSNTEIRRSQQQQRTSSTPRQARSATSSSQRPPRKWPSVNDLLDEDGTELHFSFVAHSMGGLIVRAALPELESRLTHTYSKARIHWHIMCTVSSPHLGVPYLPQTSLRWMAQAAGLTVNRGLQDLLGQNNLVTEELLTEPYTRTWRQFRRRVLINALRDQTVLTYSSALHIPQDELVMMSRLTPAMRSYSSYPRKERFENPKHPLMGLGQSHTTATTATTTTTSSSSSSQKKTQNTNTASTTNNINAHGMATPQRCWLPPPTPATTRLEMKNNGVLLTELNPRWWPCGFLRRERALASKLLHLVGPLEVYTADLKPPADAYDGIHQVAAMLGAECYAHRGVVCKAPHHVPGAFGFVSEFIACDLLHATPAVPMRSVEGVARGEAKSNKSNNNSNPLAK